MNKKILLLTPHLRGPGGVTNYYNALDLKRYVPVDYFYVNTPQKQNPVATLARLGANYIRFTWLMFKTTYGLVHLNPSLDQKSFYRDALFIAILKLFRKKYMVFFRGWEDEFEKAVRTNRFKLKIFNSTYSKADILVVLGELFKEKLLGMGVAVDKKFYLETTVADNAFIKNFDLENKINRFRQGTIIFLFISRIIKEKGIYIALDAYEQIRVKYSDREFEFIVAGDGPDLAEVKDYILKRNLPGVRFTGYIRGEAKAMVLSQAHFLLFPTNYGEGLPNCILEGMLYGMPVVTRKVAAITDIIKPGINGYITDSLQTANFVDGISQMLEDEALYVQIARTNYQQAHEYYTPEKVRNRIIKIYESVKV